MGSTVVPSAFVTTSRSIAKAMTKRGRRNITTRIAFSRLLIFNLLSRGNGVSITAETSQLHRRDWGSSIFKSLKKSVMMSQILEKWNARLAPDTLLGELQPP